MRRVVTALVSAALLVGVSGVAPAAALTPPVSELTEVQFLTQIEAANAAFVAAHPGQAVVMTTTNGDESATVTVNPDGSYLAEATEKGKVSKEMCLAPAADGKQECFQTTSSGLWVVDSFPSKGEPGTGDELMTTVLDGVVTLFHGAVLNVAGSYKSDPTYAVMNENGVPVFTESFSNDKVGISVVYSYPAGRVEVAAATTTGEAVTVTYAPTAPIVLTRPTDDQMDKDASVKSDLNATAKELETIYTDENQYPKRVVKTRVSPGNELKVCYNAPGKKAVAYTLLGTRDGGKTYWVYKSWDGGLQMTPVESKTGKLPSCGSLKANVDSRKGFRPMVNGPKVVAY